MRRCQATDEILCLKNVGVLWGLLNKQLWLNQLVWLLGDAEVLSILLFFQNEFVASYVQPELAQECNSLWYQIVTKLELDNNSCISQQYIYIHLSFSHKVRDRSQLCEGEAHLRLCFILAWPQAHYGLAFLRQDSRFKISNTPGHSAVFPSDVGGL